MMRHPPHEWGRGGGEIRHFSHKSTTKQYFKILISHNRHVFLAPSLLQCQSLSISFLRAVKKESVSYMVKRSLEKMRQNGQPFSVGYTTFYRQHLCGGQCTQEQSRPQQHTWKSKLFVIFPAETTAAHSLHFQHLYVH